MVLRVTIGVLYNKCVPVFISGMLEVTAWCEFYSKLRACAMRQRKKVVLLQCKSWDLLLQESLSKMGVFQFSSKMGLVSNGGLFQHCKQKNKNKKLQSHLFRIRMLVDTVLFEVYTRHVEPEMSSGVVCVSYMLIKELTMMLRLWSNCHFPLVPLLLLYIGAFVRS